MSDHMPNSSNGHLSFRDLFNVWIEFLDGEEKSDKTLDSYLWTVNQFILHCELEGITPEALTVQHTSAYAKEVKKRPGRKKVAIGKTQKISPGGRYALMKDCRNFLNWCNRNDYLDRQVAVPVPKQPRPKIPRLRTQAEREAFLWAARQGRNPQRDQTLISFMLETGLRNFEVRAVNWGHLIVNGELRMPKVHVLKGKGRKERWVPMPMDVWMALRHLKEEMEEAYGPEAVGDDAPIFVKENGERISKYTMKMLFKRLTARAAARLYPDDKRKREAFRITPHMLRHSYGRAMVKRGVPLPALQNWMGHGDVSTTMIYASLDEDDGLDEIYLKVIQNAA